MLLLAGLGLRLPALKASKGRWAVFQRCHIIFLVCILVVHLNSLWERGTVSMRRCRFVMGLKDLELAYTRRHLSLLFCRKEARTRLRQLLELTWAARHPAKVTRKPHVLLQQAATFTQALRKKSDLVEAGWPLSRSMGPDCFLPFVPIQPSDPDLGRKFCFHSFV
jgi:hypothetical protein